MEETKTTTARRKFLVKASAGALISTIPAKSVWATGLTNSITASGHGSDMGGSKSVYLRPVRFWRNDPNRMGHYKDVDFAVIFGANAFRDNHGARHSESLTLEEVLTTKRDDGTYRYRGEGDVNWNMIAIVMNAFKHGRHSIHYPLVGNNRPFGTVEELGKHLNTKFNSVGVASVYGSQLHNVINHRG